MGHPLIKPPLGRRLLQKKIHIHIEHINVEILLGDLQAQSRPKILNIMIGVVFLFFEID